ncbi:MAG TPA: 4-oxalocrotonate tautomerase [Clostridia bacterium]|nr:4-oxalocrotonate tautomerase [Clostridia bacterium]
MPFITIEGPDNLSKETKAKLISELTKTASQILNIPTNAFSVIIKENNPDNIGVGGIPLSEIYKK